MERKFRYVFFCKSCITFFRFFLHHAAKRASKITLRIRSPSAVFARNWTARRVRAFFERSWAAWVFSNQSEKPDFYATDRQRPCLTGVAAWCRKNRRRCDCVPTSAWRPPFLLRMVSSWRGALSETWQIRSVKLSALQRNETETKETVSELFRNCFGDRFVSVSFRFCGQFQSENLKAK